MGAGVAEAAQRRLGVAASTREPRVEPSGKGFFDSPPCARHRGTRPYDPEVFGPVATLLPYAVAEGAAMAALVRRGDGCLGSRRSSPTTPSSPSRRSSRCAPFHGRLHIGSPPRSRSRPRSPVWSLPMLVHGGPGRAGGGEELGGQRGLSFYMQRTALLQAPSALSSVGRLGACGTRPSNAGRSARIQAAVAKAAVACAMSAGTSLSAVSFAVWW